MAEGRGRYFDSKAEAVAAVEALHDRGLTNIDVGCMQINLHHHADAFEDLNEAFDPEANVAYGAEYLAAMFAETRSWHRAAGRYHSSTPEYERPYRVKVLALWNERRRLARGTAPKSRREAGATIDHSRTESLNARVGRVPGRCQHRRTTGATGAPAPTSISATKRSSPRSCGPSAGWASAGLVPNGPSPSDAGASSSTGACAGCPAPPTPRFDKTPLALGPARD